MFSEKIKDRALGPSKNQGDEEPAVSKLRQNGQWARRGTSKGQKILVWSCFILSISIRKRHQVKVQERHFFGEQKHISPSVQLLVSLGLITMSCQLQGRGLKDKPAQVRGWRADRRRAPLAQEHIRVWTVSWLRCRSISLRNTNSKLKS